MQRPSHDNGLQLIPVGIDIVLEHARRGDCELRVFGSFVSHAYIRIVDCLRRIVDRIDGDVYRCNRERARGIDGTVRERIRARRIHSRNIDE